MPPTDRQERYRRRTPASARLYERACEYLPGGETRSGTYYRPYPVFAERGSGARLTTVDGSTLLDCCNNYTQAVLGHAPEPVVEAVCDRFRAGNDLGLPTAEVVELARRLVDRTPSIETVRFCNSGSEAVTFAVRAARAYTGTDTVLLAEGGYHGSGDAVAVDGYGAPPAGDGPGADASTVAVPFNDEEALVAAFERRGDDFACLLIEPVLGVGGAIPATPAYLQAARDLTETHDVPLLFDEVMTYRLGVGGAQERYGITPDLTVLGKLVGGGLPVGAFGGREDLMAVFHPVSGRVHHSGSFNGNPATMAGGVATLEAYDARAVERLNGLGDGLRTDLRAVADAAGVPAQVTGDGSLFQVHLTEDPVTDAASSTVGGDRAVELFFRLLDQGVLVAPSGLGSLSTPMDDAEVAAVVSAFETALLALADAGHG